VALNANPTATGINTLTIKGLIAAATRIIFITFPLEKRVSGGPPLLSNSYAHRRFRAAIGPQNQAKIEVPVSSQTGEKPARESNLSR
jgi:hypothetical protein